MKASSQAKSPRVKQRLSTSPLEAIKQLTDAWIRKDGPGMLEHLTDDVTELGPAFPGPLIGKKNFSNKYQAYLAGTLQIESYRIVRPRVVWLSAKLALVHFLYKMTTQTEARCEQSSGQESMLVERQGGCWRVKFIHWHRT